MKDEKAAPDEEAAIPTTNGQHQARRAYLRVCVERDPQNMWGLYRWVAVHDGASGDG